MAQLKIRSWIRQYRYVLVVLLAGLALMLLPQRAETSPVLQETPKTEPDMETRLEEILCRIQGAGSVAVMLTEETGAETVYQTDGERSDTVLVTDASRSQQGLVRTQHPPSYRGVIVVCSGADRAAVRLAITQAVANVTGLGTDRITVLKME